MEKNKLEKNDFKKEVELTKAGKERLKKPENKEESSYTFLYWN